MPKFMVNTNITRIKFQNVLQGSSPNDCQKRWATQHSIGKTEEQENKVYSKLFCDLLKRQLKIPSDRIYTSFFDIIPGNAGWNNSTFA